MGKFDGILLASDWDGTLFYNGEVSAENKLAIEYFMSGGGYFTICSGRYFNFLKSHSDKIKPNTYSICLNGAYIADLKSGEVLYKCACDERLFDYIDAFFVKTDYYDRIMLYPADSSESVLYTKDEYENSLSKIKGHTYYKAVLYAKNEEAGDLGSSYAKSYNLSGYCAVRSFRTSLEIILDENTKGKALKRLQGHLGAALTVAVGDYENDISMLRMADIGYAVENAKEDVKAAANKLTVCCSESALAKVIYDIEFNVLPKIK